MCKGCVWNQGIVFLKNRFGIRETKRKCGFCGLVDMALIKLPKGVCRAKEVRL
jgi:hypothetical protein